MDDIGPARDTGRRILESPDGAFAVVVVVSEVNSVLVDGVNVIWSSNLWIPDRSQVFGLRGADSVVKKFDLRPGFGNARGVGKQICGIREVIYGEDVDGVWIIFRGPDINSVGDESAREIGQCESFSFFGLLFVKPMP